DAKPIDDAPSQPAQNGTLDEAASQGAAILVGEQHILSKGEIGNRPPAQTFFRHKTQALRAAPGSRGMTHWFIFEQNRSARCAAVFARQYCQQFLLTVAGYARHA